MLVFAGLPAIFVVANVPSFVLGNESLWLLRWRNVQGGTSIEFHVPTVVAIALGVGLVGSLRQGRSPRQ